MPDLEPALRSRPIASESPADVLSDTCQVLVIGGGPAGSTCAALLARRGIDVVLIEKDQHPRFHIGESLLPANLPLFEQLGVADAIAAIGMKKDGVDFNSPDHPAPTHVEFSEAWDKTMPSAWQVRRSEFDEILLRNAQARGARVMERCRVRDVAFDPAGLAPAQVETTTDAGVQRRYAAQVVVDASGRDTFLANRLKTKQKNRHHHSAALYAHFTGVERLPGTLAGNISIFWFDHGWFWLIPLRDGTTSIGAVCWPSYLRSRKTDLNRFLLDTIALSPKLAERMRHARLCSNVSATGNYAYQSSVSHGDQYLLLGDAYAFVDPVFSSGVFLAMQSAFEAVGVVEARLQKSPRAARAALRRFDRHMRRGPREFSWFIYRMTNPTMRELFMAPRNVLRVKEGLLAVLAGDIFRNRAIWPSVYAFKTIYYLDSMLHPHRTYAALRARANHLSDAEAVSAVPP